MHLTGSFHQGFSARMQARGGSTPRAASQALRRHPGLRRLVQRFGEDHQSRYEVECYGVGDVIAEPLGATGLHDQFLNDRR
jgi:hypothetical protein